MSNPNIERRVPVESRTSVSDVAHALLNNAVIKPVFEEQVRSLYDDIDRTTFDITLNQSTTGGKHLVFHIALTASDITGENPIQIYEIGQTAMDKIRGESQLAARVFPARNGMISPGIFQQMEDLYDNENFSGLLILATPKVDTHTTRSKRANQQRSNNIDLLIIEGAPQSNQWQIVDTEPTPAGQERLLRESGLHIIKVTIGNN